MNSVISNGNIKDADSIRGTIRSIIEVKKREIETILENPTKHNIEVLIRTTTETANTIIPKLIQKVKALEAIDTSVDKDQRKKIILEFLSKIPKDESGTIIQEAANYNPTIQIDPDLKVYVDVKDAIKISTDDLASTIEDILEIDEKLNPIYDQLIESLENLKDKFYVTNFNNSDVPR